MQTPTTGATAKERSQEARRRVLGMVHKAQTSHIASNFSVIDIATVLHDHVTDHDEIVWSKGWAAATIYYFLAKRGKIPEADLDKFPNAPYLGLAETTVNGVLCNGGAVGHGTPIAVGIALAKKLKGEAGRVYCIMSDGELNEGVVWESLMLAMHHKLDNLVFIVDRNHWQAMGRTKDIINVNWENAFKGFGAHVGIFDGHNPPSLSMMFQFINGKKGKNRPHVAICNTIKGKGVSFFEDHLLYHYKNITVDEYDRAMKELV